MESRRFVPDSRRSALVPPETRPSQVPFEIICCPSTPVNKFPDRIRITQGCNYHQLSVSIAATRSPTFHCSHRSQSYSVPD